MSNQAENLGDIVIAPNGASTTKIIEIIGPPGVGKSKLYKTICKLWSPKENWTYSDRLLAPEKPSLSHPSKWLEFNVRQYMGKRLSKSIPVNCGLRFIEKHMEFADFCWKHLQNDPAIANLPYQYRAIYFLFSDFCRYQAIMEKNTSIPCLIDEGFSQKSFLIRASAKGTQELLNRYLPLVPKPNGIVSLNSNNMDFLFNRIKTRKKVIASHINKDDHFLIQDLKKWKNLIGGVTDYYKNLGIPVYEIDAELPLNTKTAQLTAFLNQKNKVRL